MSEGLDPYLESMSSGLYVPASHSKPEAVVKAVWNQLLGLTESTNWAQVYKEGKTKWELHAGMVHPEWREPRVISLSGRVSGLIFRPGRSQCSGAWEAGVLQQFAINARAKRVLEIGLFTGTTTARPLVHLRDGRLLPLCESTC